MGLVELQKEKVMSVLWWIKTGWEVRGRHSLSRIGGMQKEKVMSILWWIKTGWEVFSLLCCWVDMVSFAKHGIGGVAEEIRDVCVFVRGLELDGKCDDDDDDDVCVCVYVCVCVWVGGWVCGWVWVSGVMQK